MKKGSLALMVLGVTAVALLLAGPGSAHRVLPEGSSGSKPSRPAPSAASTTDKDELETSGTATSAGGSITVTGADGSSITCAVPPGLDLTPFLSGRVKVECELVNGVLTLKELKAADGTEVEVDDDGTVEVEFEDDADEDLDDDRSGPSDNSGPGSADDDDDHSGPSGGDEDDEDQDDEDEDHSGPGGGGDD